VAARINPGRTLSPLQEAELLRKEQIVLEHKTRGWSFARIEREFKFAHADRIFKRAIRKPENEAYLRAEAIRVEELRLDALQDGIWDKAVGGDARAVEVCLKVLERRARMFGLDFADMISGQLVEVEQAKVKVMGAALVAALRDTGLPPDRQQAAADVFFAALASGGAEAQIPNQEREEDVGDLLDDLGDEDLALL
jgi:hypothetical protein